jgi:hypothetical protein
MRGQDSVQARVYVKSIGTLASMSLPEATVVSIIEAAVVGHKKGVMLRDVLLRQENLRSRLGGSNPETFSKIVQMSVSDNAAQALFEYIRYQLTLSSQKNPNSWLSDEELLHLIPIAYQEILGW